MRFSTLILCIAAMVPTLVYGATSGTSLGGESERQNCLAVFDANYKSKKNLEETRRAAKALQALGVIIPTEAKAVLINMDTDKAGFIVEVGTSQDVIHFLDDGGKRSATILDSVSHNGKKRSNRFYGVAKSGFVSLERLVSILNVETAGLEEDYIKDPDPDYPVKSTKFFVFGDTVSTRPDGNGHAWVGIRFQSRPEGPWNTVKMHVRLLDPEVPKQSKALGVLGTNLIYGVFHQTNSIESFFSGLKENLTAEDHGEVEIDGMHFEGPDFAQWTDAIAATTILKMGLAQTVLLTPEGNFMPPSQYFHDNNVLLHELTPDLQNFADPSVWQQAAIDFTNATNTKLSDQRHVNWLPLSAIKNDSGVIDTSIALKMIQALENIHEPVIFSNFNEGSPLSLWAQLFHVKNLGALYESNQPLSPPVPGVTHINILASHILEFLGPSSPAKPQK